MRPPAGATRRPGAATTPPGKATSGRSTGTSLPGGATPKAGTASRRRSTGRSGTDPGIPVSGLLVVRIVPGRLRARLPQRGDLHDLGERVQRNHLVVGRVVDDGQPARRTEPDDPVSHLDLTRR